MSDLTTFTIGFMLGVFLTFAAIELTYRELTRGTTTEQEQ